MNRHLMRTWEGAGGEWETIRDKEGAGEHCSTEVGESWLW
jgi:hypothetical protein